MALKKNFALLILLAATVHAGNIQLVDAVKKSDAAGVKTLLAQKADVKAAEVDGTTALHWAAESGNAAITDMLLAAGADAKAANRYSMTPMALAAEGGHAEVIERLIKAGVDVNATFGDGQTALMSAALNGNVDAVRVLLKNGAQVNAVEKFKGQTALMWAAGEGNSAATATLVEFGADVKAKSKGGFTAFLFSVLNDRIPAMRALVEHGANLDDRAPDGSTALNVAIINGHLNMASALLDLGADPKVQDLNGTPLHSLMWMRKPGASWEAAGTASEPLPVPRLFDKTSSLDLAKKLIEKGADPNARITWKEIVMTKGLGITKAPPNINLGRHQLSFVGSTPFYNAARNGDAPMMRLLVSMGANPNINTEVGVTPLMAAACLDYYEGESPGPTTGVSEAERLEAVKLALDLGNDINAHTNFGDYPVVGSPETTLMRYPDNIDDLLGLGVGDPRWDGMTAVHGSILCNQNSILEYLISKGADLNSRTDYGWTPLMITKGIFMANSKKEFPAAARIIEKALAEKGTKQAAR
ncbi:MAG: ankyrin repeat domain-containing protein [Acidobacteriota bacterium]